MILQWKDFNINLKDLDKVIRANCTNYKCITACENWLEIKSTATFTQNEEDFIQSHYDSLTEIEEQYKFNRDANLYNAIKAYKEDVITLSWDSMSVLQRKALCDLDLTEGESTQIFDWWLLNQ